jgi:hypothetical protein
MIGTGGKTGGERAQQRRVAVGNRLKIGLCRLAEGQRAGFIQRQPGQFPSLFKIGTALDQDAMAASNCRTLPGQL